MSPDSQTIDTIEINSIASTRETDSAQDHCLSLHTFFFGDSLDVNQIEHE